MQIADYVPTWTKIILSSANCILQSVQYFSQIHGQKAQVLPLFAMHFWYGMTAYVYPTAQSVMVFCIGFTISYTRRKKTAFICIY